MSINAGIVKKPYALNNTVRRSLVCPIPNDRRRGANYVIVTIYVAGGKDVAGLFEIF